MSPDRLRFDCLHGFASGPESQPLDALDDPLRHSQEAEGCEGASSRRGPIPSIGTDPTTPAASPG